jgi:hypothetical protein
MEASKPGSTSAKGISQKSASEFCHTKGKLVGKVKPKKY